MQFRFADLDLKWTGVDDTTPDGHVIATGFDSLGNIRVFLWAGDAPSDDAFRGSLLLKDGRVAGAYGPRGAWVASSGDQTALLARLARA